MNGPTISQMHYLLFVRKGTQRVVVAGTLNRLSFCRYLLIIILAAGGHVKDGIPQQSTIGQGQCLLSLILANVLAASAHISDLDSKEHARKSGTNSS
jgi:hypothetical protein